MLACGFSAAASAVSSPEPAPADAPLKIVRRFEPAFPSTLLVRGVREGEVRIIVLIDAAGAVADLLVTSYTHRAFADVTLAALRRWRFEPARARGEPIETVLTLDLQFEASGLLIRDVQAGEPDFAEEYRAREFAFRPHRLDELDRTPQRLAGAPPVYPRRWEERGVSGDVVVSFYIDQTGRTRMPVATKAAHPLLAGAAVAAVDQWQFEPPTRDGQPVLLRTSAQFSFAPPPPPMP